MRDYARSAAKGRLSRWECGAALVRRPPRPALEIVELHDGLRLPELRRSQDMRSLASVGCVAALTASGLSQDSRAAVPKGGSVPVLVTATTRRSSCASLGALSVRQPYPRLPHDRPARHVPRVPPLVRHAPSRGRLRHPHGPGHPRAHGRRDQLVRRHERDGYLPH